MSDDQFPGYEPKNSPDTLLDYRPALADKVKAFPDKLAALLVEFDSI